MMHRRTDVALSGLCVALAGACSAPARLQEPGPDARVMPPADGGGPDADHPDAEPVPPDADHPDANHPDAEPVSPDAEAGSPCGNGVLDPGETCDVAAGTGPLSCPTLARCDDDDPCTRDAIEGDGTCAANCEHSEAVAPDATTEDRCCPPGATNATDADCSPLCGNGVVETGEACDPVAAGSCITVDACDAGTCEAARLITADPCNPTCATTPLVPSTTSADQCCPEGANAATDVDCVRECGNGVVEPGEDCDGTPDCASCRFIPTAFRITRLSVSDPPFYFDCNPIGAAANDLIAQLFSSDDGRLFGGIGADDGFLDLSFAFVFRPMTSSGSGHRGEFVEARCNYPLPATTCSAWSSVGPNPFSYEQRSAGECLAARAGTVNPGTQGGVPPLAAGAGGCFVTGEQANVMVDLGSIEVPMRYTQIAGRWSEDGNRIEDGLMVGFVTHEQAARVLILPPELGNVHLNELLVREGGRACGDAGTLPSDEDVAPDGTPGYWFYYAFTAEKVDWTETP